MLQKKNAIVLMVIGEKYRKFFLYNKKKFILYAKKIDCDLIICDQPPDKKNTRSLTHQKMLFPSFYNKYEWIASLDIDMIISKDAPSIFDCANAEKGFGAYVIPRHSQKWKNSVKNLYSHSEEILKETHKSYFKIRNFPKFPKKTKIIASINGGVMLFNTKKVSKLFRDAYYSHPIQEKKSSMSFRFQDNTSYQGTEEAFLAYFSQINNLFFSIPEKFNNIVFYNIFEDLKNPVSQIHKSTYFKFIRKIHNNYNIPNIFYPKIYKNFLLEQLKKSYFLTFHGKFPYRGINLKNEL